MSRMTNYMELGFLNYYFNASAFAVPAGLDVSWHTTPGPDEDGDLANEIDLTGGGPTGRLPITFAAAAGRQVANANQENIASSAAAGTVTHWGVHRTDLTRQMLCYGPLTTPIVLQIGTPVRINAGGMVWDFGVSVAVFTDYVVNNWLAHIFNGIASPQPTVWFTSLHDANPTDTGLVGEFTEGGYARESTQWEPAEAATTGDTTDSWVRNTNQLDWSNLSSAGGDTPIDYWGVWDNSVAGNFLARRNQNDNPVQNGSNASAPALSLALRVN